MTDININDVTPMMQQYLKTKAQYQDCILFYRLGDFYEMFFDDAKIAAKELDLTLTGKSCGLPERAPMCGIPHHAAESYVDRLVQKGYKVAICEQLVDPKLAKGIVERGVIRVVTPGTNIDAGALDEKKNNYLLSVLTADQSYGIAVADISTGAFIVGQEPDLKGFMDALTRFAPSEIICTDTFLISPVPVDELREKQKISITSLESSYFEKKSALPLVLKQFNAKREEELGIDSMTLGTCAAGALLRYLKETQKSDLLNLNTLTVYHDSDYMILDSTARRNLELTETLRDKERRGSLLWVLDQTKTAMGARFLRTMVEQPLTDPDRINARLDAVEELVRNIPDREELREYLGSVYDLERLLTRITYRTANPRDLVAFRDSVGVLPAVKQVLSGFSSELLKETDDALDPLTDLYDLIRNAINDDPPVSVHDGGIIRPGYRKDVDELKEISSGGKTWLNNLENEEREKTGIKNLRIRYNKVFGYYIEVTNSYRDLVPDRYIRKQTLANAERYYTEELKNMEDKILGSEDRLVHLENEIYQEILTALSAETVRIQKTAKAVAFLDAELSLAAAADRNRYTRPAVDAGGAIRIRGGRHPVVEKMIPEGTFIDNDTFLDDGDNRVAIITGPNMAGKSTFMRQTALIVLMAQMGSFVPAAEAEIGIVDRIFTRVGASDDLGSGQSTFMIEMNEVANILKNATADSLLILDEIGRGTSTYDGLSIAEAVVLYVSDPAKIGAKTLFATHYHELTELEGRIPGVHNYCSAVREGADGITFLRKIVHGGADRSYGIEVARLAGVPEEVLHQAEEILKRLTAEGEDEEKHMVLPEGTEEPAEKSAAPEQLHLTITAPDDPVIEKIRQADPDRMTPIEALSFLADLKKEVNQK